MSDDGSTWGKGLLYFLYSLAEGMTEQEILKEYPQLTLEDVLAAIAFGAEVSRERIAPVPTKRAA